MPTKPNPKLREATLCLALSIRSAYALLVQSERPSALSLRWMAGELERLAGEAYRLADECDDDPCAGTIPGFDQQKEAP